MNVCTRIRMNIRLTTIVFFLLFSIFASSPNLGLSTWSNIIIVIVNRCDWLGSPANIKGANKDAKIYVGRSATLHILLFRPHTLCMNYVTNTFLLVCSSISGKQPLCFVQGQGQKREQKHTTKNFDEFHNHSPLLTMINMCYLLNHISMHSFRSIIEATEKFE